MNKPILWIIILLAVVLIAVGGYFAWQYPLWEKPGFDFGRDEAADESVAELQGFIRLFEPVPNQLISSPLLIRGEARGVWFFEGSFPVKLVSSDGDVLAEGFATASGDWMTDDYVYFQTSLEYTTPAANEGVLILIQDDPSGLGELKELQVPVTFSQESETLTQEIIRVTAPTVGQSVTSPIVVSGEARGQWYFEGDFPLTLEDANGNVIAEGYASASGDWMTENFVPFSGSLTYENPPTPNGTVVLKKDNPSGLAEHDDEVRVPVTFK